ncbi:HoxN/HupN/NixA family nickel/cobalt transporter [Plantactinospora soyae]|uniref:ABC-type nickel/cobalt efflux system permease component RcnA n=1 Tax=Plantactinospora soyae TaxID=1544732 RepID=A0A927R1X1_9ACTN|nr:High-affinity nickel-transporter [Plantactinospora soyae]MBE1491882.1 ABC-type nickel/cobalt efflux system permease component RcnA [Plantactinospora soyae]
MNRIALVLAGLSGGLGCLLVAPPGPAQAHPLGNFSVNQLAAVHLHPDRVEVAAEIDLAELPTLQESSAVDTDRDGTPSGPERAARATADCGTLAGDFEVVVAGRRLDWTVDDSALAYADGAAGLPTSRLRCRLVADATLDSATTVGIVNRFRTDRVGWRELTAVGHGVRIVDSPLPVESVSGGLRTYPEDLLSSPLDVRSARLRVEPDATGAAAAGGTTTAGRNIPAGTGWTARAEGTLRDIVGSQRLTPLVGVLAVLLALVLGAAHAALPGHGKTVMAAYLAGRAGRPRDAVTVGATVTLTHTGGVLLLGLLLTSVAGLVGETVLGWLGVLSGALIAVVGLGMLVDLWRRRRRRTTSGHTHPRPHTHGGPDHDHDGHHHGHHDHAHDHRPGGHHHRHPGDRPSRLGILGIGISGGLVPSPSALVILLGAIGLGRTGFGVLLVIGYGVGMAATLTAAGLLVIRLRERWDRRRRGRGGRRWHRLATLSSAVPTATAGLVLVVGLVLAGRGLTSFA